MSKKGNAVLNVQTSSTSAVSSNNIPKMPPAPSLVQNLASGKSNKSTTSSGTKSSPAEGCKKCAQEFKTGQKNNLRHAADCRKKKSTKRHSNGNDVGKKKLKPTEPIYVNLNPARRTSFVGVNFDSDLISSVHSTRRDLTGGSGLGIGGFEVGAARSKSNHGTPNQSTHSIVNGFSLNYSSSKISDGEKTSRITTARNSEIAGDDGLELDISDSAVMNTKKPASMTSATDGSSHAVDNVIVLDDSEDESILDCKIPPVFKNTSADVEVIEID